MSQHIELTGLPRSSRRMSFLDAIDPFPELRISAYCFEAEIEREPHTKVPQ